MAVVSRISKIRLDNGLGSFREWVVTAAVQDSAAGASVTITITQTSGGAVAPGTADIISLQFLNSSGSSSFGFLTSQSAQINLTAASQTITYYLTTTGDVQTDPQFYLAGTIEMNLRVAKTTGGPTATYDVTSKAGGTTQTGFTFTTDRGWIRGSTTAAVSVSNVALGGAAPATWAYTSPTSGDGGDPVFMRVTYGAYRASPGGTINNMLLRNKVTPATVYASTNNSTAATATRQEWTAGRVIDNRFPAASTVVQAYFDEALSPLTGITEIPLTTITYADMTVDPRVTRTPLFQLDDNTFATPPITKNFASHLRLSTQQGFLSERLTNARGEGVNGLTYNVTLTPTKPGSTLTSTGLTSQVQGGQDGWGSAFLAWASSLPGGTWTKALTITAPSDITGATYAPLVAGGSADYSLVAKDPNLEARLNVQHIAGLGGRHFEAGMALIPTAYLVNVATGLRVLTSAITTARVSVVRASTSANADGSGTRWEHLQTDGTWLLWDPAAAQNTFAMVASTADTTTMERVFTTDANWGTRDIRFNIQVTFEGVIYTSTYIVINVDSKNRHDGYQFDGGGFVGFPTR